MTNWVLIIYLSFVLCVALLIFFPIFDTWVQILCMFAIIIVLITEVVCYHKDIIKYERIEVARQEQKEYERKLLEDNAIKCLDLYGYKLLCYSDSDDDVELARLRNGLYQGLIQVDNYTKTVTLINAN